MKLKNRQACFVLLTYCQHKRKTELFILQQLLYLHWYGHRNQSPNMACGCHIHVLAFCYVSWFSKFNTLNECTGTDCSDFHITRKKANNIRFCIIYNKEDLMYLIGEVRARKGLNYYLPITVYQQTHTNGKGFFT